MIIYDDKTLVIPVGVGPFYTDYRSQEKSATATENGVLDFVPDEGFDGLSGVHVEVNIDTDSYYNDGYNNGLAKGTQEGYDDGKAEGMRDGLSLGREQGHAEGYNAGYSDGIDYGYNEGYHEGNDTGKAEGYQDGMTYGYRVGVTEGKELGIYEQKSKLGYIRITGNGTYIAEDGYNEVNVNIDTTGDYDEGFVAGRTLGKTEGIQEQKAKLTNLNVTRNGEYETENGYKHISVNVPSQEIHTQTKIATSNGVVTPDEGYDALSSVTVNVKAKTQTKTVTPTTQEQVFTPSAGNDGFSKVTVHGVSSSIDSNIKPENIKKGVEILGVIGTAQEGAQINNQNKTVTSNGIVTYDEGFTGLGNVTVSVDTETPRQEGYAIGVEEGKAIQKSKLTGLSVHENGTYTREDGYSAIEVNVPIPEYKSEEKTVTPSTTDQTITPSAGFNGMNKVIVSGVNSGIDANIKAENIKKDVTILGVTGTLESEIQPTTPYPFYIKTPLYIETDGQCAFEIPTSIIGYDDGQSDITVTWSYGDMAINSITDNKTRDNGQCIVGAYSSATNQGYGVYVTRYNNITAALVQKGSNYATANIGTNINSTALFTVSLRHDDEDSLMMIPMSFTKFLNYGMLEPMKKNEGTWNNTWESCRLAGPWNPTAFAAKNVTTGEITAYAPAGIRIHEIVIDDEVNGCILSPALDDNGTPCFAKFKPSTTGSTFQGYIYNVGPGTPKFGYEGAAPSEQLAMMNILNKLHEI